MRLHREVISAFAGFTLLATVANAQTAISSTFQLGVFADANQNDFQSHTDSFAAQQFGTLNPYSHSLSVTDVAPAGGNLTVNSSASASWANAGQGSVLWRGMGWAHNTQASSGAKLNGFVINGPVWSYTFQATFSGAFSMSYDVRGAGNQFGLLGAIIEWSGQGGNLDLTNPNSPVASGTFVREIVSGTNYTVGVFNMGNIFTSPLPNTSTGSMDADFNWSMSPVPEPLSIVGIVLGSALLARRRRRI